MLRVCLTEAVQLYYSVMVYIAEILRSYIAETAKNLIRRDLLITMRSIVEDYIRLIKTIKP